MATKETKLKLEKYISTRDSKISKLQGYPGTPLKNYFEDLMNFGFINVGGRASCGKHVDLSWKIFEMWREVVKKAITLGYNIEIESIPQKNRYATTNGGFWQENKYRLIAPPENT